MEEWNIIRTTQFNSQDIYEAMIEFEFRKVETHEPLLCDLSAMVHAKALSAYQAVRVPCVVEHAGLILSGFERQNYPGGLTQPMWDALGAERFVSACAPLSDRAIARAVIGYCDGANIQTFVGETQGSLRASPAGKREFYWDTIFCPDGYDGKTYAEIADNSLAEKLSISQSIKALNQLVAHRSKIDPLLFPGF